MKSGAQGGWPFTENCLSLRKLIVSLIIEALSRKSARQFVGHDDKGDNNQ